MSTLDDILRSKHFNKSKRYPALLEYCVKNVLRGDFDALKERIIGYEVFGRAPDYDTADDPVVRIAAGEVRRRLAQYFNEHPDSPLRIELPLGGYCSEFHFSAVPENDPIIDVSSPEGIPNPTIGEPQPGIELDISNDRGTRTEVRATRSKRALAGYILLGGIAIIVVVWALGTFSLFLRRPDFWQPFTQTNKPVVVLLAPAYTDFEGSKNSTLYLSGDVRLPVAVAAAHVCGALKDHGKQCQILPAENTTLSDIYGNSVVLVGTNGNPWLQRLMAPLRFQFFREADTTSPQWKFGYIVDRKQAVDRSSWFVDYSAGPTQKDYFVIARFHSEITDGPVVIASGLGSTASRSAVDYITSPGRMTEILSLAPPHWKGSNFEVVCQLELIQGHPGHVKMIASEFW